MVSEPTNPFLQEKRIQILTMGGLLFLMVFAWEMSSLPRALSLWALLPVAVGAWLVERRIELPLVSPPIHVYHFVILATALVLGPTTGTLVTLMVLAVGLARTTLRFPSQATSQMLHSLPALLSIWLVSKLYVAGHDLGWWGAAGSLLPGGIITGSYFFIYTALATGRAWLEGVVEWMTHWRKRYFIPSLLVLSMVAGAALVDRFAQRLGSQIYLLAIPFLLFVWTTYSIYSTTLGETAQKLKEHTRLQMSIIETLALAIDAKDHTTHGHVRRVQAYALGIAKSLGIDDPDDMGALRAAALLHDIGKLAIPEYILSKPGKLSESEYAKMVRHVEIGANILEPIQFPYPVVPIVRHHHERYDGSGYPFHLRQEQIPLGSRILAVADTFDALTAPRPYRSPLSVSDAIEVIEKEAGKAYDPEVVRAFSRVARPLAEQVALMDTSRYGSKTHLPETRVESSEEHKLWLHAKSINEIASAQQEIYTLYEIFQTVGKSLNTEDTMRVICSKLQSLVPFSSCVVYLQKKDSDSIFPSLVTGEFADQLTKNHLVLGEGLTGYVVAFGKPVTNADPSLDFSNLPYLERPHQLINSLIFPLKTDNSAFGAIALYSTARDGRTYSDEHVRLMETVVGQAATFIHNAISFESYAANSLTDPLTGMPNSRFMFMAFEQNVKKAERHKEKLVVLVMDLNNFKEINDKYGHKIGDEVLIKVSRILQKEMRKYDTCIRYAGDEFVAFLYNTNRDVAEKIVLRIKRSVSALVIKVRSGKEVRLGISVGMSIYPEDGAELNQLFTVADSQMYNDKYLSKAGQHADGPQSGEPLIVEDEIQFSRIN
ncbi:MAG: diguanylate cyclase [Acidobacteriota bacterium]